MLPTRGAGAGLPRADPISSFLFLLLLFFLCPWRRSRLALYLLRSKFHPIYPPKYSPTYSSSYISLHHSSPIQGTCPYVQFTCSRGHVWKAEPGTPACFYCPRCREATRNVKGLTYSTPVFGSQQSHLLRRTRVRRTRTLPIDSAARFRERVGEKGGKVLGAYTGAKRKVKLRCVQAHEWEATPDNILRGSWSVGTYPST